jgi:CheY-like chemotaxis protein
MVASQRVLLVDDHDDARELLSELCAVLGHEVAQAATGHQALEVAAAFLPTVAILDLRLPDIDGFEVARRLRQAPSCPRLIALSGSTETRSRAIEHGFDDYVIKPIDAKRLQMLIMGR